LLAAATMRSLVVDTKVAPPMYTDQ
jgi:hypothetical protein